MPTGRLQARLLEDHKPGPWPAGWGSMGAPAQADKPVAQGRCFPGPGLEVLGLVPVTGDYGLGHISTHTQMPAKSPWPWA